MASLPRSIPAGRSFRWIRLGSLALILVSLVLLARLLPVDRLVTLLSSTVDDLGMWGPVAFAGTYILAAVLFVPGSSLTLAAGVAFGLAVGTIVVSVASTVAAAISFLIGRHVARDAVRRRAAGHSRFAAIDRAIGQQGWKIIALLRLSPAVPFSLGNYLFGITSIRFWPYVLASWLAMLPGTFMYVYLGYAGRAGLAAASGSGSRSPAQWIMLIVGLAATVAVTLYVTRLARRAVQANNALTEVSPGRSAGAPAQRRPGALGTIATAALALILAGCATFACANPRSVTRLFGPPAVTMQETYAEKPGGPTFDHSAFDVLLHEHVDTDGRVDYSGLKRDAAALDAYIEALGGARLDEMGRSERLALLINAYNAFTLRLILDDYPVKSIKDIPGARRWDAVRWTVGGRTWSLNQIEHEQIRPHFADPRIHFALVCAAVGCPPLRNEAYRAEELEAQLEAQARYVHAHDRWFRCESGGDVVYLTRLYAWYRSDFEQAAGTTVRFAARYSSALAQALDEGRQPTIRYLDYDWSLNRQGGAP